MPETPAYRTPIDDVVVHDSGWLPLDDVHEVTALPLWELGEDPLFARLSYDEASFVAARLGGRLLTMAEVWAVWRRGVQLNPVTLWTKPTDTLYMRGFDFCERHDRRVWEQLDAIGWNGQRLVANAGKDWIHGASAGKARNGGWILAEGRAIQPGGPGSEHHGRDYTDYSQLTRVIRPIGTRPEARDVGWFGERIAGHVIGAARELGLAIQGAAVPSVALLALEIAEREAKTVREATGRNDGPVSKYFAETVRDTLGTPDDWSDDKRTGWASGWEWCAASASWCTWEAYEELLAQGYSPPMPPYARRIAVHELVSDARRRGHFHEKGSPGRPRKGDLGIYGRGGGDPTKGGIGHVGRFKTEVDGFGEYVSLDGNAGIAWGEKTRSIHDADFRGWISHE